MIYLWVALEVLWIELVLVGAVFLVVRKAIRRQLGPLLGMTKPLPKKVEVTHAAV